MSTQSRFTRPAEPARGFDKKEHVDHIVMALVRETGIVGTKYGDSFRATIDIACLSCGEVHLDDYEFGALGNAFDVADGSVVPGRIVSVPTKFSQPAIVLNADLTDDEMTFVDKWFDANVTKDGDGQFVFVDEPTFADEPEPF